MTRPADEPTAPVSETQAEAALPAVVALQRGELEKADQLAASQIAADASNPYPRIVRAIARYKKTMIGLGLDGRTLFIGGIEAGTLNQKYLKATFGDAEADLAAVDADLDVATRRSGISMELCLACWKVDWNGNGRIDERDEHLFEIEMDAAGEPIPEGDPRRRPTFRFDDGDIAWARAFVSFERAGLDVLLGYDWSEVGSMARRHGDRASKIVIRLADRDRIQQAKQRILEGLEHSDAARRAYLAETDDDREWFPNPRQASHPIPMPVDQALYETWSSVLGDVHRIVEGKEGVRASELLDLAGEHPRRAPTGYLDFGRMLAHPKDIVLDLTDLERMDRENDVEAALRALFGEYYVPEMKPSPLPKTLLRMKGEIDKGEGELDRKLRYLLWIN